MRLESFRVQRFRNIIDSTEVPIDPAVTCLVGKNESGKTALLQALWRCSPHVEAEFNELTDYPRWRLASDRKARVVHNVRPIQVTFALGDDDMAAVESSYGPGVLTDRNFGFWISYDGGDYGCVVAVDESRAVCNLVTTIEDLDESTLTDVSKLTDFKSLREWLSTQRNELSAADEGESGARDLDAIDAALKNSFPNEWSTLRSGVGDILIERLPTFFYFGEYQMLPGRLDLRELESADEHPAASALQTARALLKLAGTDVSSLGEENYEDRKAELEAVGEDLSRQVFEYWRQNPDLSVEIDVDKETITTQAPYGQSVSAVARYLDLRVKDRRHGYTNNFGQRSSGFQWFFSFLAAFSEFEYNDTGVIVLLDEPALALHGRAQADFLRFIEERLAPTCQVIYTTHSPFMVDVSRLERVRVVEDKGPDAGAIASTEILAVGQDTIFPLQGALGYEVSQSLFIGDADLVIEGTSDFTYLTIFSDFLAQAGRTGLDPKWRLLPTGSSANVPAFVALVGRALDVTVLVDASTQGMQRLNNLAAQGMLMPSRLLTPAMVTGTKSADIEDLFDPADYLRLYNGAFNTSLTIANLPPGDRIVDRIGRATGEKFTAHGKPADWFLRHRDIVMETISPATIDQFLDLFEKINATLP